MSKILLATLLAVTLPACGLGDIGPRDTVMVSAAFTPEQQEQVIAAADEWNRATRGAVNLDLRIGADLGEHAIVPGPVDDGDLGTTVKSQWRSTVTIRTDLAKIETQQVSPLGLKHVMLHELGHGFGLHYHSETGIMTASIAAGAQTCLTLDDVRAYCEIHDCPKGYEGTCH